jgi:hypothetical protein
MSRAGWSDRLGRDGLSHPGDRHLPGGAKADATEARVPTDTGAARADKGLSSTLAPPPPAKLWAQPCSRDR